VVAESGAPGPTVGADSLGVRSVELPELKHTVDRPGAAESPAPVFELVRETSVPEALLAPARCAAQAAGYAAGWAQGARAARLIADAEAHVAANTRERAEARRADSVHSALSALDAAATELERRSVPGACEIEELIVSSALSIAEALVGASMCDDAVRGHAALTRALALVPAGSDVTVALSPADFAVLDGTSPDGSRTITLVEDSALAPGDARARCGATAIDARISAGLARVRELLGAAS
jgi:flagellar assembly protein FliH